MVQLIIMIRWFNILVSVAIFQTGNALYDDIDDADLNITQIINKYGYPVETHEIQTEDGYLLDVYRIPYGRNISTQTPNVNPVLVTHGLLGSAENFILLGPEKSLSFMLADHGYDVWLVNARGTWHSRKHKSLNPDKDPKFWEFSWNEIGVFDLPATIDYILNTTNAKKLHYIGHSQGTTAFFVMCSEKPSYNSKVKVMMAMAPSAILENFNEPILKMISPLYPFWQKVSNDFNQYELIPFATNSNIRAALKMLCGKDSVIPHQLCGNIIAQLLGDDEMDKDMIPLFFSTIPGGGSVRQALHYAQIVASGSFRKYDYGTKENMKRYNSKTPPEYNFKNIVVPVVLLYGETDNMVTKKDVAILGKLLPNVIEMYKVPTKTWTHMDFIWAKNVDTLLYKKMLAVMAEYDD